MSEAGEYLAAVEHPADPGWITAMTSEIPTARRDELAQKYSDLNVDTSSLIAAVDITSMWRETTRHFHERVGVARLLLDKDEEGLYRDLAGYAERIGEYIEWFGQQATRAFKSTEAISDFTKIGLDMGGKRLIGRSTGARHVDDMITSVPAQLKEISPDTKVSRPDPLRQRTTRYKFLPEWWTNPQPGNRLDFGVVTERRGIMDINVPTGDDSTNTIEVFKSTSGLIVMSQLPELYRTQFHKWHKTSHKRAESKLTDSPAAALAGRILERATVDVNSGSLAYLPIGMHYIMVARRDKRPLE